METHIIEAQYINEKNISYTYSVNQYKVLSGLEHKETTKLADIAEEITDGTRVRREYKKEGIRIINISDFKNGSIYPYNIKFISRDSIKEKDFVKEGDVLITAVGKSGQLAIVPYNLQDCVISSDIIRIRLRDKSKAAHIVSYLRSELGYLALESLKLGNLNRISISDIKEMLLPKDYYTINIEDKDSLDYQKKANKIYEECLRIFEDVFQQNKISFKIPKLTYVNPNFIDLDRLDPEHYTYYESELYKLTQRDTANVRWQSLKDLVEIKKSIRPKIEDEAEIKYVNLSNVDSDLSVIKGSETGYFSELSSRVRYVLGENEVITAKVGSATGTENHVTAVVTSKYANMMASDAFYNLIPKDINPYYLMFIFKQPIILKQIKSLTRGLYFKSITRSDFESIRIPRVIDENIISNKMKEYVEVLEKYYKNKKEKQ